MSVTEALPRASPRLTSRAVSVTELMPLAPPRTAPHVMYTHDAEQAYADGTAHGHAACGHCISMPALGSDVSSTTVPAHSR